MRRLSLHRNQQGIVSFFVIMIIMVILTLIVLAFAQLVRREQQQTADRQLNQQAFYAAESGINDVKDALRNAPNGSPLLTGDYTTNCNDFIADAGLNPALDANISYSCLLVDSSPPELTYSSVPTTESVTAPINSATNAPIRSLQISWEDSSGATNRAGCPALGEYLPAWPATCSIGMLRIELVPFTKTATTTRSRDDLITDRAVAFLQPSAAAAVGSGTFTYGSASGDNQGLRHVATCGGTVPAGVRLCRVLISGTDLRQGFLRMRSLYRRTAVTVRAFTGVVAGTGPVDLAGAQAEVDATGRAADILKRVKVSFPIPRAGDPSAEFALQTTNAICKRLNIIPPSTVSVGFFDPTANDNPCNPAQTVN